MYYIKHFSALFLITLVFTNCSSQQEPAGVYDEKNYVEEQRGRIENANTILFRNKDNPDYTIRKRYSDSLFRDSSFLITKYFCYKNFLNGPTEAFSEGHLTSKGFFKMNKKHGEFIQYDYDGNIIRKEHYNEGKRAGIWEFYNSYQILYKKIYYDDKGEFAKKDLFNTKTGKYERTDYKPDRLTD